jgi:hypothetical protein
MAGPNKTPWHLWLVGVLGLLWNGYGATDFAMSMIQGDAWYRMNKMTDVQIAAMHSYPWWMYVVWFAGTWGAIIGTVLLLFRSRWAVHAYLVSLVGFLLSLVYAYFLSDAKAAVGQMAPMHGVILVGCLFFLWYAWTMAKRGVLR